MKAFIPYKLAEVLFALVMAYLGYWHFTHAVAMGHLVPSYIPGPGTFWAYVSGTSLILAAIAILTDIKKTLACYLLALLLLIVFALIDFRQFNGNPIPALKDLAIAFCALMIGSDKR